MPTPVHSDGAKTVAKLNRDRSVCVCLFQTRRRRHEAILGKGPSQEVHDGVEDPGIQTKSATTQRRETGPQQAPPTIEPSENAFLP